MLSLAHMEHFLKPTRRQLMQGLGAAALAGPMLSHTPLWGQSACAVLGSPSLTEGPYFVDEDMNRRDIRIDPFDGSLQPGIPLSLAINVSQLATGSCMPTALTGAYVDIWHCSASGVYSDVGAQNYIPCNLGEIPDYYRRFIDPVHVMVIKTCPIDADAMASYSNLRYRTSGGAFRSSTNTLVTCSRLAVGTRSSSLMSAAQYGRGSISTWSARICPNFTKVPPALVMAA